MANATTGVATAAAVRKDILAECDEVITATRSTAEMNFPILTEINYERNLYAYTGAEQTQDGIIESDYERILVACDQVALEAGITSSNHLRLEICFSFKRSLLAAANMCANCYWYRERNAKKTFIRNYRVQFAMWFHSMYSMYGGNRIKARTEARLTMDPRVLALFCNPLVRLTAKMCSVIPSNEVDEQEELLTNNSLEFHVLCQVLALVKD